MKNKITLLFALLGLLLFSFKKKKEPKSYSGFELKSFEKNLALIPKSDFRHGQWYPEGDWQVGVNYNFELRSKPSYKNYDSINLFEMSYEKWFRSFQFANDYDSYIDSFYMSTTEVSNGQYLEFVNEIKQRDTFLYKELLPDTLVWRSKEGDYQLFVEYYFRHPTYSNYPVVGVSYEQASLYCIWLTEKYLKEEKRTHKKVKFRLPAIIEWACAASGGVGSGDLPWEEFDFKDKKGSWLANFRYINQRSVSKGEYIDSDDIEESKRKGLISPYYHSGVSGVDNEMLSSDLTVLVKSYKPNNFGLYCMAGNVEELVLEKGITKGGGWNDPGAYLLNYVHQSYDSTNSVSNDRGFRFAMEILD